MAYGYYSAIDIQSAAVGANESNFPVALVLTDSRFATTGNGGNIENTDANGGASGSLTVPADFVVSPNTDGSSPYDFEIVDYDATTGYIELWVEVTSVSSSTDTTIYLVYGDSGVTTSQENVSGTWGNGFELVLHLGEGGGTAYDSSGNDYDATDNASATGTTGQVGDGQEFDGSDDYYTLGEPANLEPAQLGASFCFEAWARTDTLDNNENQQRIFGRHSGTNNDNFALLFRDSDAAKSPQKIGGYLDFASAGGINLAATNTFSIDTYYSVAVAYDGSTVVLYIDGSSNDSDSSPSSENLAGATGSPWTIGAQGANDGYRLSGFVDEVRVSSVNRDSDWIATSYNNQDDPTPSSTFWSALGAEQAITETTINLTWQDNSEHEDGFSLERRQDGGAWSEIDTPAADDESYSDTGVDTGHTYDYRIKATSTTLGDSEWSDTASETV